MPFRKRLTLVAFAFLVAPMWGQHTSAQLKSGGSINAWIEIESGLPGRSGTRVNLAYICFSNTGKSSVEVEWRLHGTDDVAKPHSGKVTVNPHKDGRRYDMRNLVSRNARIGGITIKVVKELPSNEIKVNVVTTDNSTRKDESTLASGVSIHISGKDVYIAGNEIFSSGPGTATKWKNKVRQRLRSSLNADARSIFVSGKDVYVAGYQGRGNLTDAVLWKNGIPQILNSTSGSLATSVIIHGSDVYVAGRDGDYATLWKNGVAQHLNVVENKNAVAHSVFVDGTEVYVAGKDGERAVLWKNGELQILSN